MLYNIFQPRVFLVWRTVINTDIFFKHKFFHKYVSMEYRFIFEIYVSKPWPINKFRTGVRQTQRLSGRQTPKRSITDYRWQYFQKTPKCHQSPSPQLVCRSRCSTIIQIRHQNVCHTNNLPVRFLTRVPAYIVAFSIVVCDKTMVDWTGAGAKSSATVSSRTRHRIW